MSLLPSSQKKTFASFLQADLLALLGLTFFLLLYYPELFLDRAGALNADHLEQHYPWAFLLWDSLRHGTLPFWTPLIQCGFPIAAEGQIGVFYLPNLILNALLPIRWAYAYTHIVHFLIAGWGTYAYARRMKLIPVAAFVAAFIYLFGASYGGAYYNITSLKTLVWFPLMLLIFEHLYTQPKVKSVLGLGFIASLSILAGYLQIAILSTFIFSLYVLLRIFCFSDLTVSLFRERAVRLVAVSGALLVGIGIALPQLLLTAELALRSNRALALEGYAYVGSLFPGALVTLIFPLTQTLFRANCLYLGVFALLLMCFAVYASKKPEEKLLLRLWTWIALFALLLALGQWSPLYVALIKATHFYAFRVPAKFLIFICFAMSMICGVGFQKAWLLHELPEEETVRKKVSRSFLVLVLFSSAVAFLSLWIMSQHPSAIRQMGDWFVSHFLFQKPGHPHSLLAYQEKMAAYFNVVNSVFSLNNPWARWSYGMIASGVLLALILRRPKIQIRRWLAIGFLFLTLDLYAFSLIYIKTNFDSFVHIQKISPVTERLLYEMKSLGGRIFGFRQGTESLPLVPSMNMLYSIEDIGAYTPLVFSRYYETIGQLGNVNDSTLLQSPSPQFVLDHLNLLSFLDVTFVLSTRSLDHPDLLLLSRDLKELCFLYRNQSKHSRAFFMNQWKVVENWKELKIRFMAAGFDPRNVILLERSELRKIGTLPPVIARNPRAALRRMANHPSGETWQIQTDQPGFFVLSNALFPGWHATVNGKEMPLVYADGLFQAIWLEKAGPYNIDLKFVPSFQVLRNTLKRGGHDE